jgi:2-keto-3-deoxy-L-rhamnonate aldolase RhmA
MTGRQIRAALRAGQYVYSTAVVAVCSLWPRLLQQAAIDFAFVDSEHTPLGRETLAWLCRAYASVQVPTVVRIPSPDPHEAAQVLDGGADGFIAPYIETAEQVRQLTAVARYRPLKGARASDAVADPESLEPQLRSYLQQRNADTIFIVNIESVPAIENLEQILAVGSVDAVLIGPHDLTCSLGIPEQYDHPRFDQAVRHIFQVARGRHVGAGIHFWTSVAQEIDWARTAGANLIMHASDASLFGQALQRDLNEIRAALPSNSPPALTPPSAPRGGGDEPIV